MSRRRLIRMVGAAFTAAGATTTDRGPTDHVPSLTQSDDDAEIELGTADSETAYDAVVGRAQSTQRELLRSGRTCSADADQLESIDRAVGEQLRVYRDDDQYAVYTVTETRDESDESTVRMGLQGRERLDTADTFDAVVESTVPHPTLSADEARDAGEFIERMELPDDATVAVLSPHGGDISPATDDQADTVVDQLSTPACRWGCQGWADEGSAFDRWYVSSHDIAPASFPELASITDRGFEQVVSFRGISREGVYISGVTDDDTVSEIADAIDTIVDSSVPITTRERPTAARPEDGAITHRLAADDGTSVWIGQGQTVRDDHADEIAVAVSEILD